MPHIPTKTIPSSTAHLLPSPLSSYKDHMTQQMEKLVQQQRRREMELMKTAMLKHEETFRQQVHDLHRLYRLQKQLMSDLAMRPSIVLLPCHQQGRRRRRLELPDDEHLVAGGDACTGRQATPPSMESEDELQLTLAVGNGGGRTQRKQPESTPYTTPSSSTDSGGREQHHQRATACDLREGVMVKQPQWLVQCLSLKMA